MRFGEGGKCACNIGCWSVRDGKANGQTFFSHALSRVSLGFDLMTELFTIQDVLS